MIIRRTFIGAAALAAALNAASAFAADIKIGASGPLTGSYASYGLQLEAGVKLAIEDINAQGGILGNKLELLLGDDQGEPKQGVYYENTLGGGLGWCGVHPQDHFHPSRCGRPPAAGLTLWPIVLSRMGPNM
jgi:branched-chain amino acid transport system substrate-binding protein